jgi:hypothetical protein
VKPAKEDAANLGLVSFLPIQTSFFDPDKKLQNTTGRKKIVAKIRNLIFIVTYYTTYTFVFPSYFSPK